jgi:beta-glucanase (GH16 family)
MAGNLHGPFAAIGLASWLIAGCSAAGEAGAAGPLKAAPDGRPLVLTFADEFNSFDRWRDGKGAWRTTFRDGRADDEYDVRTLRSNKELELYADPEMRAHGAAPGAGKSLGLNPFHAGGGMLTITADRAPGDLAPQLGGFRYTSGLISTQPSFSQTYGYFEMRAKLPRGKGVWPAFWLLPLDLSWPPEIDIMESVGDPSRYYVTAHSTVGPKDSGTEVPIAPDTFHVFAVSWDRDKLIWFVDGREVKRLPTPPDLNKPMYILANLALGGDWAGAPDASTPFPAHYVIDYVRAYRFAA